MTVHNRKVLSSFGSAGVLPYELVETPPCCARLGCNCQPYFLIFVFISCKVNKKKSENYTYVEKN
jgi:hypothetical protein